MLLTLFYTINSSQLLVINILSNYQKCPGPLRVHGITLFFDGNSCVVLLSDSILTMKKSEDCWRHTQHNPNGACFLFPAPKGRGQARGSGDLQSRLF